jgi:phage antirepressor YoqD-like protein
VPFTGWSSEVTPREIAGALDVSEKSLRSWLRENPRQVIHAHSERWVVTPDEADRIVAVYRASRS